MAPIMQALPPGDTVEMVSWVGSQRAPCEGVPCRYTVSGDRQWLTLAIWALGWFVQTVEWRGKTYRVGAGSRIELAGNGFDRRITRPRAGVSRPSAAPVCSAGAETRRSA